MLKIKQSALAAVHVLLLTSPELHGQTLQSWTLVPEIRIGDSSRQQYTLTTVGDLEVGSDGSVFIAQSDDQLIRVYDRRGRFLRTIGRRGSGPGEFRRIDALGYGPRGLYALDLSSARLTLFSPAGTFVRQWTTPEHPFGSGLTGRPPIGQLRDGSLVVIPRYLTVPDSGFVHLPVLLFDTAGRFRRQIGTLRAGDQGRRAEAGGIVAVIHQPVSSHSLYALAPDGSAIVVAHRRLGDGGRPGEIHILRITPLGDTILSRRYRVPAVEVAEENVEAERERVITNAMRGRPFSREQMAALYRIGWTVPKYQAPIDLLVVGAEGWMWIRRGSFAANESTWWVINASGDIVARVTTPSSLRILRVTPEYVWAVTTDESDEPVVLRLRINRSTRSSADNDGLYK